MSEKYEREIEEILRKASFAPAPRGKQQQPPNPLGGALSAAWRKRVASLSPTRLLTTGMVLAFTGYILREFFPEFGAFLSLIALAMLAVGLALSISRRNDHPAAGWRGRSIDLSAGKGAWIAVKRFWSDLRRGRGPGT